MSVAFSLCAIDYISVSQSSRQRSEKKIRRVCRNLFTCSEKYRDAERESKRAGERKRDEMSTFNDKLKLIFSSNYVFNEEKIRRTTEGEWGEKMATATQMPENGR